MIIKSHVRGGFRAAATYLKAVGENEKTRLVDLGDPSIGTLDEAFRRMWEVSATTRARKPLHHVSINPHKDERLTDGQVLRICARLEEKYGYRHAEHQRVIVEHVKDGRQHFHVMWNRVSLDSGRPAWPGHHWRKSKEAAREMEVELGLKRPTPRKRKAPIGKRRAQRLVPGLGLSAASLCAFFRVVQRAIVTPRRYGYFAAVRPSPSSSGWKPGYRPRVALRLRRRREVREDERPSPIPRLRLPYMTVEELIAWAWENRRSDILTQFGIYVVFDL